MTSHIGEGDAITLDRIAALVRETTFPERPNRRRIEEAVSHLSATTDLGLVSGRHGLFIAETVEELDRGLAALRKHALSALKRRQGLRRARAKLMGQMAIGRAA